MKKHMKELGNKLLAFCMALAMVVTSLAIAPVTAKAEDASSGTELTIHFKNEKNWDTVYGMVAGDDWAAITGYEYCKNSIYGGIISANTSNSGWYSLKISTTDTITTVNGNFNCGAWNSDTETNNQTADYKVTVADGTEAWITYESTEGTGVTVSYTAPEGWTEGAEVSAPTDPTLTDTGVSKPEDTQLKLYYYILDSSAKTYDDYALNVWGGASLTEAGTFLTITAWGNQQYRKLLDAGLETNNGLAGKWAYVGLDSNSIEGMQFLTVDGGENVWNSQITSQGLTEAYYVPGYGWFKEATCDNEIKAPDLQDEFYIVGDGDALGNWGIKDGVKMIKTADGVYQAIVAMTAGTYSYTPVQDPVNFAWEHQYKDSENDWANYSVTVENDCRILFTVKNPDSTSNTAEVTAEVAENVYTVEFKDGDTVLKTEIVEAGKAATAPTLPTKDGYTASWDKDFSNITADTTVNVVWTENAKESTSEVKSYTVTFKDGDSVLKTETVEAGKAATAPELPTKTGYTASWDKDFSDIAADTIVNVTWTANTYTLTYNVNGGSKLKNSTKAITYDSTYGKLATPKRKGYTFKGWYTAKTKGTKVTSNTKVTGDVTIYAQWKKVTKPGKVTVKSVKNSAKKTMKVSVKSVKGADGYEIRYSTKKSMKGAKKVTTTKTSTTIKKLTKGKTYYVQVRAYKLDSAGNKVYSSKYSKTTKVTIKK